MTPSSTHTHALFYQFSAVFLVCLCFTQGINFCHEVRPRANLDGLDNCPLTCSAKFLHFDSNDDLLVLCRESGNPSTFLPCKTNNDCRYFHIKATCKRIPCFCEGRGPFGNQTFYVLDSKLRVPNLDVCTVFQEGLDHDVPQTFPPFPWSMLLIVFGIVTSCAACLVAVRWLSPFIRRMQSKSVIRNRENRRLNNDNTTLFASVPLPERTYVRPCGRYPNRRAFVPSGSTSSSDCNADKPPPYELVIQGPPAYHEVEEEPLNPDVENPDLTPVFLNSPRPVSVATV